MPLVTDGLLLAAALFAGIYCVVLSRRVRALKDLDTGIGGAITRMTRALEDARRALEDAKGSHRDGNRELKELIVRAEAASGQLRILLAATRDLAPARGPDARTPEARGAAARQPRDPEEAAPEGDSRPVAPVARREPPPIAPPPIPVPALDPLRRLATTKRAAPMPASEDELLAALAEFAAARS